MSFAAPLFLLAALAGILPILLHLIHRQKAREIPFPTLRFLHLSVQRTRRRKYLDDALLLALRVTVLALLALGLAGPALTSLKLLAGGKNRLAAVIVLDNSGSMDAAASSQTSRFSSAREHATGVLGLLDEGDSAALLLTCGPPSPVHGRFFRSHTAIRQELAAARIFPEQADLAARLQQARSLLSNSEAQRREIYIITDNQALSWQDLTEPRSNQEPAADPAPVVVIDARGESLLNTSLRRLTIQSPAPIADAPVTATVEIANPASIVQQKHLELRIDGAQFALSPTLSIPAAGSITHLFQFTLDKPGIHRGEVALVEDDASPLDNRQHFVLNLDPPLPLTIIKARRHEIPQADDAFYLERALASTQGARLTTLTPDQLTPTSLAGQAVVFCVNLPALEPPATDWLSSYVHGGGHLIWIPGPNVDPAAYNRMNSQSGGPLLPGAISPLRLPPAGNQGNWPIAGLDASFPPLEALTDPPSLYQSVLVFRHFPISGIDGSPLRVLATLDDGQPLLVSSNLGQGSVLWLGTALREDATNLPLKPLFLPLLSRLTFHLAGLLSGQSQTLAGAPITIPLGEPGTEVEIVRPTGAILRLRPPKPDATSFPYADTHDPGIYFLRPLSPPPPATHPFAVNGDPDESNDTPISPQDLRARFAGQPLFLCATFSELAETTRRLRQGTSLRDALLALVLAALVFEAYFANRRRTLPPGERPPAPPTTSLTTDPTLPDRIILGDDQVIVLGNDR